MAQNLHIFIANVNCMTTPIRIIFLDGKKTRLFSGISIGDDVIKGIDYPKTKENHFVNLDAITSSQK
jgi:hypothetical protein